MSARSLGSRHSPRAAWLAVGPLGLLAALLTLAAQVGMPIHAQDWWLALVFLGAYLTADLMILRFEVRRQVYAFSLDDLPLLLALFYLPPVLVVLVRVLSVVVTMVRRRQAGVKIWFNLVSLAAGAALAGLIVSGAQPLDGADPQSWLILAAAFGASTLLTHSAVIGVITLVQGRIDGQELGRMLVPGISVAAANLAIGLVVLVLLQQTPWAAVLLGALAVIFLAAYRAYASSLRHGGALQEMYELTREMANTPHDGTLVDVFLGRVREMLKAEFATLWVPADSRHPEVLLSSKVDYTALIDLTGTPAELRRHVYDSGETLAVGQRLGGDQQHRSALTAAGSKDAIIVPLRAGSAVIGCLEVAGRLGDTAHFGPGDVQLLETIAAHAAVAVENTRLVDRLRYDAYHDSLTRLPNRRRVTDGLAESLAGRTPSEVVAAVLLDVGGLRNVNESLGRGSGDQLLVQIAARLREVAPPAALVGRVGGDTFAVVLRLPDAGAAEALATDLREQLRRPLLVGSLTLAVEAAVGVVVAPDHGDEAGPLLQRADVAVQAAKGLASGRQVFNPALESGSARRLGLAADLKAALDRDELSVYFQPKVALADRRLVGVECLARWEHPAHGAVAPEDFVAVAEHTGLLGRLTEVVLSAGLRRARHWADTGHPLPVAVNLSARMVADPLFPGWVERMLETHGVPPDLLTLEFTEEGAAGQAGRPLPILRSLADLGVRLSVDDFGTGSSSLSYLRELPVHEVKIDRSFVQGMATDASDLAIVRAVVDLSRHFGLVAVAEGVESELTLGLLAEMGCDVGQGFLFSRPLPYERLEAWLVAQTDQVPSAAGQVRRLRAVG